MRLSQLHPHLPPPARRQLHLSHGVFFAFHEGAEQSLFQKTFAYLLRRIEFSQGPEVISV
jgi:hypothetical protein